MKIKDLFSPNRDITKRSSRLIRTIIIHYTGMQSERESLNKLRHINSKVSCHYLISTSGTIYRLVNDYNIAWHAGKSCWHKYKNLNKNSIGIELVNKGHQFGYTKFTKRQISQLIALCKILVKKYKISKKNIIGHSDIAPARKIDPGEKFPWELLSKKKIGLWHNVNSRFLKQSRKKKTSEANRMKFIKNLNKIGYCINSQSSKQFFGKVVRAFQRHFRQDVVDGQLDVECLIIALNLAKKS